MTAVALDFCAEELELRGGREVGRCKVICDAIIMVERLAGAKFTIKVMFDL